MQNMFEENWDDPSSEVIQPVVSNYQKNYEGSSFSQEKSFNQYNKRNFDHSEDSWGNFHRNDKGRYSRYKSDRSNECYQSCDGNYRDKARSYRSNDSLDNDGFTIKVEGSKIGKIIGKQGAKIKELQEKSGARIKIGNPCEEDNYLTNVIIIGDKESQRKCEEMIKELVTNKPNVTLTYTRRSSPVEMIDWDKVNQLADKAESEKWVKCPPLKKNFYIEDSEVANMSPEEVETFRKNYNNIVVKNVFGKNEKILNPVKTFAQAFQHYPDIMREIKKQGFELPSPIQCQAWPILLSGQDLIGIAQTGTGKTLAFLLPALIHIDGQSLPRDQRGGANVLVIAPTRELALQIEKEVQKYSYKDIKCVCVYGGGNRREQMNIVTQGVEIIIATPGRLNDLVEANVIDVTSVTYLVLDEADRMLDMGFEPQIRKVLLDIRPDRQSVMTSATWPPDVQRLAERYMCNPIQVYIGSLDLAAVHSVTQTVLIIDEEEKKEYLLEFIRSLSEEDKVIVFVGKKIVADNLSCDLSLDRILCQCIHGNREQIDREQALEDIKTGAVKILIATDVASRGIDIADITKVFNYDFPRNIEEYVHRVGRTGRAGKTGEAITLFTRADWAYAGELITIMEEANQAIPQELYNMRDRFSAMKKKREAEGGFKRGRGRDGRNRFGGSRYDTNWAF